MPGPVHQLTMASFTVIEHLNVVEHVGPGLVPGPVTHTVQAFPFE